MANVMKMPSVAVIVPSYFSGATIVDSLRSFEAQDYDGFELIVVDSTPDLSVADIVCRHFPQIKLEHVGRRLLPHEARNLGADLTEAEFLLFTDPDIIAPPDWISRTVRAQQELGGVVFSPVDCYQSAWLAEGIHFCKYNHWLSGREEAVRISVGPTSGMLCRRADFEKVGRFPEGYMLGDTLISWRFTDIDVPLHLLPSPAVQHWHTSSWGKFLRERCERAREFGLIRVEMGGWGRLKALWMVAISILLPLRFMSLTLRGINDFRKTRRLSTFLVVSPVVLSGYAAWLAGESRAYLRHLLGLPQEGPCRF